jgi:hypothetical protein
LDEGQQSGLLMTAVEHHRAEQTGVGPVGIGHHFPAEDLDDAGSVGGQPGHRAGVGRHLEEVDELPALLAGEVGERPGGEDDGRGVLG